MDSCVCMCVCGLGDLSAIVIRRNVFCASVIIKRQTVLKMATKANEIPVKGSGGQLFATPAPAENSIRQTIYGE